MIINTTCCQMIRQFFFLRFHFVLSLSVNLFSCGRIFFRKAMKIDSWKKTHAANKIFNNMASLVLMWILFSGSVQHLDDFDIISSYRFQPRVYFMFILNPYSECLCVCACVLLFLFFYFILYFRRQINLYFIFDSFLFCNKSFIDEHIFSFVFSLTLLYSHSLSHSLCVS